MNCDYCDAIFINGVFCHEHGCNSPIRIDSTSVEEEEWFEELEDELLQAEAFQEGQLEQESKGD